MAPKCSAPSICAVGYHQCAHLCGGCPQNSLSYGLGHYEFKVLCFGLTNAPATFQSLMNDLFRAHLGKFVLVYLDDMLVFSKTPAEHAGHLRKIFEILREHRLYAKMSKCASARTELEFLGHVVSAEGVKVDPRKVAAVEQWAVPTSVTQLRSFLGLSNYFRRFIQGLLAL